MLRLALSSLRTRAAASIGTYIALLFAAAMVCACGVLLDTGVCGSVAPERYSGAPVIVTADQQIHWTSVKKKNGSTKTKTKSKQLAERVWLPDSVRPRLTAIPGATVIPDVTFAADVIGQDGALLVDTHRALPAGHNWSSAALTPFRLTTGRPPRSPTEVVVDTDLARAAHLRVGSPIGIRTSLPAGEYVVVGIAGASTPISSGGSMFFVDDEARRLSGRGTDVTAYGLIGADAQQVRAALLGTTAQVSTGRGRGTAEFPDAAAARGTLTSIGGAVGGTSLTVAIVVIVGTIALSTQQRRRSLALLRAVGATPRQVRRMLRHEALILAIAAGVPGAMLGFIVARVLRSQLVSTGVLPATVPLAHGPIPALSAVLATAVAAVVAARVSARRITRIKPSEAMTEAAVEQTDLGRVRVMAGLIAVAVAAGVTVVLTRLHTEPAAVPVTYLSVLLWMIAVALLGPMIVRGSMTLFGRMLALSGVGGFLAAQGSRSNSRRVASTVTPLALMIGMATTVLFMPTTLGGAAQAQTAEGLNADYVVESSGLGVPAQAVDALRSDPGVQTVTQVVNSTLWVGRDKRTVQGLTPRGVTSVIDPRVVSGSLAQLSDHGIAMSTRSATGRRIGDTVPVTLGDGTASRFTLVAVYERGLGFGDALVSFDDLVGHVDNPIATTVYVRGAIDRQNARSDLHRFAGVALTDGTGYQRALADRRQRSAATSAMLMGLIVAFTAIAVVNTLAMSTIARSRDVSLLRLIGTTIRQIWQSLRWELAVIVGIATALGTAAAWCTLTAFSIGMIDRAAPIITPATYGVVIGGAATLAAIAMSLPARILLRRSIIDELARGR